MNLIVDIGNTFIKLAVFEEDTLVYHQKQTNFSTEDIHKINQKYFLQSAIISSVRDDNAAIDEVLQKINIPFVWLNHQLQFPFKNHYKTPKTLGLDRLAAVAGAMAGYPKSNRLVIDMGTCVTFDFVDENNIYYGGSIAPGFQMRLKALHQFTQKLPLILYENQSVELIGDSTENSILSGVYNGYKYEILGIISAYEQQYNDLKIVLTGGDYKLFDLEVKNRIFADEFLVLKGLCQILKLNEKN